jgi:hypothetical protein
MKTFARYLTHTSFKWNVALSAIACLLAMALCASSASAQSGAGSIQGTVTDVTGSVIQGASIHIVNPATNVAADTKSNAEGFYLVPSLFTGTYSETITAPGMKSYKTSLELLVDQHAVINPILTAGDVTQQVEVASDLVQLTTTDNGTISSTLENSRISQLPMNGRLLLTLAGETTPGLEGGGQRANGLMAEALEYVGDGVPLTNRQFGGENGGQALMPDPDSVQEIRVETTNTSAQYAAPATGIITTKSGTNVVHGSFFETARNNAVGIAKNRNNASNFAAPHLVRNEFGGSAGGPIVLPHVYHGKDKSFWFFAYERYSLAQVANYLEHTPMSAWEGGDFSGLNNSSNVLQNLMDPATTAVSASCLNPATGTSAANNYCRTQFNYNGKLNAVNPARLNTIGKLLYDIAPRPTTSDDPLVTTNYNWAAATYQVIPTMTFRLDHSFNENNKAYLRYQQNPMTYVYPNSSYPNTIAADGFPANLTQSFDSTPGDNYAGAVGFTHVFSPTFFSETVVSQQWYSQTFELPGEGKSDYNQQLGFPNNFGAPEISAFTGLVNALGGTDSFYGIRQILSNIDENLTKTLGRHQMQFGGRFRHERIGMLMDKSPDTVAFGSQTTGLEQPSTGASYGQFSNTGNANADMFLGSAQSYTLLLQPYYGHFHDMEFDAYLQDNYHLSKSLTVNVGLRYEAHPAPWVKYGLFNTFDLKTGNPVSQQPLSNYVANGYTTQAIATNLTNLGINYETPQQAGLPSSLLRNNNFTVGPRVGLAYQPFGGKYGTVIRSAYGRYIYPIPERSYVKNALTNVPFYTSYSQDYTAANQTPDGLPNYLLRNQQSIFTGVNSANVVNTSTTTALLPGITGTMYDPHAAPDFVTQMNFTVEQPLKGNSALRLTWLWSHGSNLDHYYYPNSHPSTYVWEMGYGITPPSGSVIGSNQYAATATGPYDQTKFGNFTYDMKDGFSNDNALQATYQRLFHRGVAYQINYVWSKPFRVGGNYFRDGSVYTAQNYVGALGSAGTMTSPYGTVMAPNLPPARPAGIAAYSNWHKLNVFEQYQIDTAIPLQHITFNGIVDLPLGRGKRFLGNSNRLMDELVGGWQVAGDGSIVSQDFQVANANFGATNPIKVYKHKAPITDCRSGVCYKSYQWFNGYLAPTVINAPTKGVSGLPSDYVPYLTPIDNTPGTANYGTNNVQVTAPTLNGGAPVTVAYSPGPLNANVYSKTFLNGPINYTIDLSLFKVFPITEKVNLRFNMDAFNALNMQGYANPNTTDGTEAYQANGVSSSANTPRQVQFTLRLTF